MGNNIHIHKICALVLYVCYIIIYSHNIRYVEVHIDAAYVHVKQPPEKALRMLSTQNKFGLCSKY